MVHFLQCTKAHMPLLLLLLLSSIQVAHSDAEKEKMAGRALIGSRPPRCERLCMSCGHCEAIQVPIVPHGGRRRSSSSSGGDQEQVMGTTASEVTYRDNGYSNYKPLSWKCKCGGIIFDP